MASLPRAVTSAARKLGFFASLYRQVTLRCSQVIRCLLFDYGPRMERLDGPHLRRTAYLDALAAWQASAPPGSKSWQLAFDAAAAPTCLIASTCCSSIKRHQPDSSSPRPAFFAAFSMLFPPRLHPFFYLNQSYPFRVRLSLSSVNSFSNEFSPHYQTFLYKDRRCAPPAV